MEITGKRIRSVERHLSSLVPRGDDVVIALDQLDDHAARLDEIGFAPGLPIGQTVLPASLGPRSEFNAEGTYITHTDRPKEWRIVQQREWHWTEWHGRYGRVQQSKIVDIGRECYPRTFVEPPSVELSIVQPSSGAKAVVVPRLRYVAANDERLLHAVNLFLELFGRAVLLTENLEPYFPSEIQRVNWEILPPGEMPWAKLRARLEPILREFDERERPVLEHRLKMFSEDYPSDFTAAGRAGFRGYVVFGYKDKGITIVESAFYGNATYVFGEDWERLSQMTKAEILTQDLHQARLIHREGWDFKVRDLLA
jgi:hypothetical protein